MTTFRRCISSLPKAISAVHRKWSTIGLFIVHRKVNDRESVEAIISTTGKLKVPEIQSYGPHPKSLSWHRKFHGFDT